MYGTVAKIKVKPGNEAKLNELAERWWNERRNKVKGAVSNSVFRTDKNANEYILVAIFDSKENYDANANDPEQDKWFQEMVALFEGEPEWTDGELVFHKHV